MSVIESTSPAPSSRWPRPPTSSASASTRFAAASRRASYLPSARDGGSSGSASPIWRSCFAECHRPSVGSRPTSPARARRGQRNVTGWSTTATAGKPLSGVVGEWVAGLVTHQEDPDSNSSKKIQILKVEIFGSPAEPNEYFCGEIRSKDYFSAYQLRRRASRSLRSKI